MSAARIAANLRETGVFLGSSDINHGLRLATQTSTRLARILRIISPSSSHPLQTANDHPPAPFATRDRHLMSGHLMYRHLMYRHLMYCVRDLERCVRPADVPASSASP